LSLALWALSGRIILLGLERVLLKGLTADRDAVATASLFFGIGALTLLPLAIGQALPTDPVLYLRPLAAIIVYSFAFALYVGALKAGDATIVAPLYHGNGFFILLLAAAGIWFGASLVEDLEQRLRVIRELRGKVGTPGDRLNVRLRPRQKPAHLTNRSAVEPSLPVVPLDFAQSGCLPFVK
jgi:hypothetical protein